MIQLFRKFCTYQETYQKALKDPQSYWLTTAKKLCWKVPPKKVLDLIPDHFYRWFPDGKINITDSCLDANLHKYGELDAYYIESPITGAKPKTISYSSLHQRVCKFASGLTKLFKIGKGDRIVIYMPMVIQSIIAMLACARIGAIHVVVFGGFSAKQLANRIFDSQAKLIICSNAGIQPNKIIDYLANVDEALNIIGKKIPKIIFDRPLLQAKRPLQEYQFEFSNVQQSGTANIPSVQMQSTDPLYAIYTSGTTGKPKGILRDHGGTAVALKHAMQIIYNGQPKDKMFCSSDIGWVLGHSFIVYGPLISAMSSVLFEGKPINTPNAGVFWEIISRRQSTYAYFFFLSQVNHLYTSPTAMRSIRKEDPSSQFLQKNNVQSLRTVTVVGQRCDPPTFKWIQNLIPHAKVIDSYWQTETGIPCISNFTGFSDSFQPKPGSATMPMPGFDVKIINETTKEECLANETGVICIKQPLPPSFMLTIINNDKLYVNKYFQDFKGYYNTGDTGLKDKDGYFYIMSRIDDVINTAGHRLSTGQMQQVLMKHPCIAEVAVIGMADSIKGEVPVAFVTMKQGVTKPVHQLCSEAVALIRSNIGPVASFRECHIVSQLPKTRSGKYLRHIIKKIAQKQQFQVPSTIQDPSVIQQLRQYFHKNKN